MRIGFVVGALGRGGAELQLMKLAGGLAARNHDVHVLAYVGPSAMDDELRALGVSLAVKRGRSQLEKLRLAKDWLRSGAFDVVHAVLNRPSALALFARWPRSTPPVVVTDFSSATFEAHSLSSRLLLSTYRLADQIITETECNRDSLIRFAPRLGRRVTVIRNGVDTDRFISRQLEERARSLAFVFCVVATVHAVKNPLGVIDALAELKRRGHSAIRVDWYGRFGLAGDRVGFDDVLEHALARGVADSIVFHGEAVNVEKVYRQSDALLLASTREGFPNAVVEGMASGLPLVVSRISDLPRVVEEAGNGFVFDPYDPQDIATAMAGMIASSVEQRSEMGRRSRDLALRWFSLGRFIDEHEALYAGVAQRRQP